VHCDDLGSFEIEAREGQLLRRHFVHGDNYLQLHIGDTPIVFLILLWLGISIGMHAFPSAVDVQSFSHAVRAAGRGGLRYGAAKVFEYLVRFANLLRVIWFDLIYAVGIAAALPLVVSM
jgi:hypothetical protein